MLRIVTYIPKKSGLGLRTFCVSFHFNTVLMSHVLFLSSLLARLLSSVPLPYYHQYHEENIINHHGCYRHHHPAYHDIIDRSIIFMISGKSQGRIDLFQ